MDELDEEMQQLVAALHRADLQGLRDADKGKRRDGDTTDEQAAFAFYEEDLDRFDLWLADHRLALSFDTAVRLDGAVVHELSELERGAARDREMALHLDRGRSSSRETSASSSRCTSRVSSRASSVVGSASSIRVSREASTSASSYFSPSPVPARQQATSKPVEHVQCIICSDSIREDRAVVVPCAHSHNYCRPCLKDLFLLATRDESLFPPRCDGAEIPSSLVLNLLSSAERDLVRDKSREFSTKDRLYCSQASCSRFLGSSTDNRVLITCGCGAQTCEACKAPWHGVFGACGKGADADVAAVLAQDYGYAQCPGCRRLVELDVGCFHMTCLCRRQFCYVCATDWKNCECPQWDEARLVQTAQRRVAIQDAAQEGPARPIAERVRRVVEELRVNHECAHPTWSYRSGGGQCESCFHHLPSYLLRCRGCQLLACVRCRRNRF